MLQTCAKEIALFLRFSVAPKALLMPLTTLGYNAKCPKHVYTKIVDPWLWYVLMSMTMLDAFLIFMFYVATSCLPSLRTRGVLYLPFGFPLLGALAGLIAGFVYYDLFTAMFGISFSLTIRFNMSPAIHCFQVSLLVLTMLEFIDPFVKIVSNFGAAGKPFVEEPASAAKVEDVDLEMKSET